MSVNKHQPHVLVLPEDDANRQLANGFWLGVDQVRQFQVLAPAGGWTRVLDSFESVHVKEMARDPQRSIVLLIDFDKRGDRLNAAMERIPGSLRDRVFVLGVWSEPGALRSAEGRSYETLGRAMAQDCRDDTDMIWKHDLLRHNAGELERLRQRVRLILFS